MESQDVAGPAAPGEAGKSGARPADREGLLKHSREFLDFFWDIAKPQQETRLEATEKLLEHLRARPEVRRRGRGGGRVRAAAKRGGAGSGARGAGQGSAGRPSTPADALGSAGIGDEVRPEAPHHGARGRERDRPALLQSGPGTGEVAAPGRAQAAGRGAEE